MGAWRTYRWANCGNFRKRRWVEKNNAYTVVQKCVDKGYIERKKPKFTCKALITKEEAQMSSVSEQIEKSYPSKIAFFKAYLNKDNLTNDEIKGLFQVIDDLKK